MDSSSIYYDAGPVNGNLRFNTEYEEFNSDSPSPNNENDNENQNDNLSDSTIVEESESRDLYHNDSDDITTNLISTTPNTISNTNNVTASNTSMKSIALSNSNVLKPNNSFQYASFIKSDIDNVRMSLNETTDVLRQNINRMTNRGLQLENIEEKAESICSDASEFNNRTRALKRQMWCKNYMFHLFGFMGIFLVVIIVILSTINYN